MELTKRADTQFDDIKRIGLAQFEVVEFNKEFDSDGKEIKYLGEKEGNTTMRVAVTLREIKSQKWYPLSYYLEDKVRMSKDGKKTQYINSLGWTTWADKKENLSEKFSANAYHEAKVGEADLVAFIEAWLNIDRNQPVDLTLDWKALMKGSVAELKYFQKTDLPRKEGILGMATVRVVEKEGEIKEYSQVYGRVLAGFNMRFFRTAVTGEAITNLRERKETASATKKGYLKSYEEFILDITDFCKDIYYLGELKEYTVSDSMVATDQVLSEEDANY
jgi:hypothetical protein